MNINFFYFFFFFFWGGGVQKIEYFLGNEFFVDIIWGGHHKIGLYLEFISMHFRDFSEGQGTEWEDIFWVAKISNIYLGCLKFLIFFGVNGRCCARAYI